MKNNPPEIAQRLNALAQDATLVTNNVREFERIEGLRIENWVAPVPNPGTISTAVAIAGL